MKTKNVRRRKAWRYYHRMLASEVKYVYGGVHPRDGELVEGYAVPWSVVYRIQGDNRGMRFLRR